ncbi:EF-hand domain-containing protein [Streptomyces sp. A7024]|uniref:EF-hand domain-containing protein n=1 Tax=Streptomyces coryli TaxID=1128680 RepID=A0A6G4UDC3_9ACTN|nr:EF-hand domain-containing protein [Streptomyces coryli]
MVDKAAARKVFDKFDLNGDGRVTAAEFQQAMLAMGDLDYTVAMAQAVLNTKDRDADGTLSFEEFIEVYEAAENN